ncbi:MAG: hypothetical protein ACXWV4_11285, partial [Flavitalea sp.]
MKHYFSKFLSKLFWSFFSIFLLLFSQMTEASAQTFSKGDLFIGISNGLVQWRSPDGTLIKTLNTLKGGQTTGMAFDKDDNLYVTCFTTDAVIRFNNSGVIQGSFGSGYSFPQSIVFDAIGNAYVGNASAGIRMY